MRIILTLAFLLIINSTVFSQEFGGSNQTTSLSGGRWEFFMSDIAVSVTFIIDKFEGDVLQLVERKDKTLTWEYVKKEKSSKDIQKQNSINYQLFSSGLGIRYTFLLNTNSGLTWQLIKDENGILHFILIE